jgi:hypothetical protein
MSDLVRFATILTPDGLVLLGMMRDLTGVEASRYTLRVPTTVLKQSIIVCGNHAAGQPAATHRGRSKRNRQGSLASVVSVPLDIFAEVSMPFLCRVHAS